MPVDASSSRLITCILGILRLSRSESRLSLHHILHPDPDIASLVFTFELLKLSRTSKPDITQRMYRLPHRIANRCCCGGRSICAEEPRLKACKEWFEEWDCGCQDAGNLDYLSADDDTPDGGEQVRVRGESLDVNDLYSGSYDDT